MACLLLVDTSGSMSGDAINSLNAVCRLLRVKELRQV